MTTSFFKFMKFAPHSRLSLFMLLKHKSIFFARKSVLNDPTDCSPFVYTDLSGDNLRREITSLKDFELDDEFEYFGWMQPRMKELIDITEKNEPTELKNPKRKYVFFEGENYYEYTDDLGGKYIKDYYQTSINDAKIFSMSKVLEEPRLWAHYADGHAGFCIELTGLDSIQTGVHLGKVDYTSRRPRVSVSKLKEFRESNSSERTKDILSRLYLQKSIGWEYEKEHRLVIAKRDFKKIKSILRLPEGDYVEFPKIKVERIVFGMNAPPRERNMVENFIYDVSSGKNKPVLEHIFQNADDYEIRAEKVFRDDDIPF
jgi:Protein of unknown function (DUF2971)